jgi:hypothetical protein
MSMQKNSQTNLMQHILKSKWIQFERIKFELIFISREAVKESQKMEKFYNFQNLKITADNLHEEFIKQTNSVYIWTIKNKFNSMYMSF